MGSTAGFAPATRPPKPQKAPTQLASVLNIEGGPMRPLRPTKRFCSGPPSGSRRGPACVAPDVRCRPPRFAAGAFNGPSPGNEPKQLKSGVLSDERM